MFGSLGLVHSIDYKLIDPDNPDSIQAFAALVDGAIGTKKIAQFQHMDCAAVGSNLSFFGDEHAAAFIHAAVHEKALEPRHQNANRDAPLHYQLHLHEEEMPGSPGQSVQVATITHTPANVNANLMLH